MKIVIIEPYHTGSHAQWAEGYRNHSAHDVTILSLPGRFWKWRMHGGAVTLAREYMAGDYQPDLLLASDMLDLTTFLALTREKTAAIPTAIYFHENQLSYPWSPDDRDVEAGREKHYGFINYASAMAADRCFFNSKYHLESFLAELEKLLKHFPDNNELESVAAIRAKSAVLPLGLDLKRFDEHRVSGNDGPPLILWNHRWEYDKNPGDFFTVLLALADKGLEFQVAVLGENFRNQPEEFAAAREKLGDRVVQWGYAESFAEYAAWLWRADILPVTSHQDFFGASVIEAVYCGCFPLLPRRLAYPELIPPPYFPECYYRDTAELVDRLERLIQQQCRTGHPGLREETAKYNWRWQVKHYDKVLIPSPE